MMNTKYCDSISTIRNDVLQWSLKQKEEGKLQYVLSSYGKMQQWVVSPGLFSIQKKYLNEQNTKQGEFFILYQIIVKDVKGRKFARFYLTAAQKPTMPEELRNFYKTTLLPEMGQEYDSDDDLWHDVTLSKIEINSETTKEDIIRFLEKGLAVGEWIERRLMYLSRVSRKN